MAPTCLWIHLKAQGNAAPVPPCIQTQMEFLEALADALPNRKRQAWVDAMAPVWDQFKDDIGQDLIDAAVASNM